MCEAADTDDGALLGAFARDRSQSAFRSLVERHSGWVYAAAFRQLRDAHLAEDATQTVFVLLCQRAKNMKPQQKVSGWLFMALGYTVRSILRSRRRRERYERLAALERPASYAPPPLADDLDAAVARLSENDRVAILLRFYQGMDFGAMSRALGVSDEAAKKRVARAIARLRERLGAAVSEGSLTAASAFGAPPASAALSAHVSHVALSAAGGAPIPTGVASALKGAAYLMAMTKVKIAAAVTIIALLMGTAGTVVWVASVSPPVPEIASAPPPAQTQPTSMLEQLYGLRGNELLRLVPPPFDKVREEVYKPSGFTRAPQAMVIFWWKGKPLITSDMPGPNWYDVTGLMYPILNVWSQDVEGDPDVKKTIIPGDFVFKPGGNPEQLSTPLANLISQATGYPVTLTFRRVERPVIVFKGKWRPSTGKADQKIEVYAEKLNGDSYYVHGGYVDTLAFEIGDFIGKSVTIEATNLPRKLNWHINYSDDGILPDSKLVCQHIQEQTGLTWTVETRLVKRLFIERQK
jgi:RNA polymerase sigma factor (sigma-70 family)